MANNLEIVKSLRKMLEMLPKELTEEEKKKSDEIKEMLDKIEKNEINSIRGGEDNEPTL